MDEYILLDVEGQYWFWPGWTPEVDMRQTELAGLSWTSETILEFEWPEGEFGVYSGIRLWGAFLYPGAMTIAGQFDMVEFGYE